MILTGSVLKAFVDIDLNFVIESLNIEETNYK
jgi:hypothetical protein